MRRTIIAIDSQQFEAAPGGYIPIRELREAEERSGLDVIEIITTLQRRVADGSVPEEFATSAAGFERKKSALEYQGARVIVCPQRQGIRPGACNSGDTMRLALELLCVGLRASPDFATVVTDNPDYVALLWTLRKHGVRTRLVAAADRVTPGLRRAAHEVIDLGKVLHSGEMSGARGLFQRCLRPVLS